MNGLNEVKEAKKEKREAKMMGYDLKLNIGAFIRKATNNGEDKTMSTYWTYEGSETAPSKYAKYCFTLGRGDFYQNNSHL